MRTWYFLLTIVLVSRSHSASFHHMRAHLILGGNDLSFFLGSTCLSLLTADRLSARVETPVATTRRIILENPSPETQ